MKSIPTESQFLLFIKNSKAQNPAFYVPLEEL